MLNSVGAQLRRAVQFSAILSVLVLAGCGSQPRSQEEHPVVDAVIKNDARITNQYLAEGGDPNMRTSRGDPLLFVATGARGGLDVATTLVNAGANVNLANADGRTPLHNAAGWCNVAIVNLLLENGADVRAVDDKGTSVIDTVCTAPADRRDIVLNALFSQGQ